MQRWAIAAGSDFEILIHQSKSDLLDEPMDSLDHESRELFQLILEEYIATDNRSLFVITHSLTNDWRQEFSEIFEIDEGKFYKISQGEKPPHCHHHD